MDKAGLLKCIAQEGYNIGFGAKKHFASAEIAGKGPGWIAVISFFCGVFGLIYEPLSGEFASATLAVAGFCAFYMLFYNVAKYERAGEELTAVFNDLRVLYYYVLGNGSVETGTKELSELQSRARSSAITRQIFGSDWFAHFKFFGQQQTDWINDQLHFAFWKDKVPNSAKAAGCLLIFLSLVSGVVFLVLRHF